MTTKIKVLKTNGVSGLIVHELGKNGVTEIADNSIETDGNTVVQFLIYINKEMKYEYINGVYELEYQQEKDLANDTSTRE